MEVFQLISVGKNKKLYKATTAKVKPQSQDSFIDTFILFQQSNFQALNKKAKPGKKTIFHIPRVTFCLV